MKKMQLKMMAVFSFLLFAGLSSQTIHAGEKIIIGEVEKVALLPWGAVLPARIDTGASLSSLDVRDLRLEGKTVEFRLPESYGGLLIRLPLSGWRRIKMAGGSSNRRPYVEMELCLGNTRIRTEVTLCDRSSMEFPLLLGRKALRGNPEANFIVDVSRSHILSPTCTKENLP